MAAFIGGNLDGIEASAQRLNDSGGMAITSGSETRNAAVVLSEAIEQAMGQLLNTFEGIAQTLQDDIAQSHTQLVGTDWRGASRENAIAIKQNLQGQVTGVLGTATTNMNEEKTGFINRANDLVSHVETEFQRVMGEVDTQYAELATASRKTAENLALADQTIMMG